MAYRTHSPANLTAAFLVAGLVVHAGPCGLRAQAGRAAILDRTGAPLAAADLDGHRHYPLGEAAAQLLGYVVAAHADREQIAAAGLERHFDQRLREHVEPLRVTLDAKMQRAAFNMLRDTGIPGSVVVQDPGTGRILALASWPSFDPNRVAQGLGPAEWRKLAADPRNPLLNRAVQPATPGSVARMLPALAAARAGLAHDAIFCPSAIEFDGVVLRDWDPTRSESLTLAPAIAKAAHTYFYQIAERLGPQALDETARMFGLGDAPTLPLPGLAPSVWLSPWDGVHGEGSPARLAIAAIGQGDAALSPVDIACLTSAIATGTYRSALLLPLPGPAREFDLAAAGIGADAHHALRRGFLDAVNGPAATAAAARVDGLAVAGITGTAQTSNRGERSRNAWFTGYAPARDPKFTVTVLLQGPHLTASRDAAPLAAKLFRALPAP